MAIENSDTETKTMTKAAIKAIINQLISTDLSSEDAENFKKVLTAMSDKDKDSLRANLSLLGFYKKGGAWNAGLIAEVGDMFRPNVGAHETIKSAINVGLKTTGLATGAYMAYRGGKAVLTKMGVVGGASSMMAAAATMGAATFGE